MTHFSKSSAHGNGFLSVKEKTASLCFRCRGSDSADGFAENMDSTIGLWVWRRAGSAGKVGKEEMAGGTTVSVGKDKISSVSAYGEDHIAGVGANRGIGMRRQVVEKHVAGLLFGVVCGRCLTVGNFFQRDNDGRIATAGVVEEETGDLLYTFDTELVE